MSCNDTDSVFPNPHSLLSILSRLSTIHNENEVLTHRISNLTENFNKDVAELKEHNNTLHVLLDQAEQKLSLIKDTLNK